MIQRLFVIAILLLVCAEASANTGPVRLKVSTTRIQKELDGYESISPASRNSVADRLVLIEELVREHGRAYDYRQFTTSELKQILHTLNPGKIRAKAPAAVRPPSLEDRVAPEDALPELPMPDSEIHQEKFEST